jgi:hypothetical protein
VQEAQGDVVGGAAPRLDREQLRGGAGDVAGDGEQVLRAHPGRQQRLVRVAEGGVGDGQRRPRAQVGREPLRAQREQPLA